MPYQAETCSRKDYICNKMCADGEMPYQAETCSGKDYICNKRCVDGEILHLYIILYLYVTYYTPGYNP
jgi:hypothetical protein